MGHKPKSKRGKKKRRKKRRGVASCARSILCCFSGTNISDVSDEEDGEDAGHRQENVQGNESVATKASWRGANILEEEEDVADGDGGDLKNKPEQDTRNNPENEAFAFDETSDASEDKGASVDEDLGEKDASLEKKLVEDKGEQEVEECDEENTLEDNFLFNEPSDACEIKDKSGDEDLGEVIDERKETDSIEIREMEKYGDAYEDLETDKETMHMNEKETEMDELDELEKTVSKVQRDDRLEVREGKEMEINETDTEIAMLNSINALSRDFHKLTLIFPTGSTIMTVIARHCSSLGLTTLKVCLPQNLQLCRALVSFPRPSKSKRQIKHFVGDMYLPGDPVCGVVGQKSSTEETPEYSKVPNNLQRPLVSFIPENRVCQQLLELMLVAFELFSRKQHLSQMQGNQWLEEIGEGVIDEVESDRSASQTDGPVEIDEKTKIDGNRIDAGTALVSCGKATKSTLNRQISVPMFLRGSIKNHKIAAAVAVYCARLGLILLKVHQTHHFHLRRTLVSYLRVRMGRHLTFCAHDLHLSRVSVHDFAVQQMRPQQLLTYSDYGPSDIDQFINTTVSFSLENQIEVKWLSCHQLSVDSYFLVMESCLERRGKTQIVFKPKQRPRYLLNAAHKKTQSFIEDISTQHEEHPRIRCTDIVFAHLKKETSDTNLNRRILATLRLSAFKQRDNIFTAITKHSFNLGLIVLQIPSFRTKVVVTTNLSMKRMKATSLQTSVQVTQTRSHSVGECQDQFSEEKQKHPEAKRRRSAIGVKHCHTPDEHNLEDNASLKTREIGSALFDEVDDTSWDQTLSDRESRRETKVPKDQLLSHPDLNVPHGVQMTKGQLVNCIEDRTVPGEVAAALVLHYLSTKSRIKGHLQEAVKVLVGQKARKADDQMCNDLLTKSDEIGMDSRAACVEWDNQNGDVSAGTLDCDRVTGGQNTYEEKPVGSKRRRKRKKKRKHYGWNFP